MVGKNCRNVQSLRVGRTPCTSSHLVAAVAKTEEAGAGVIGRESTLDGTYPLGKLLRGLVRPQPRRRQEVHVADHRPARHQLALRGPPELTFRRQ